MEIQIDSFEYNQLGNLLVILLERYLTSSVLINKIVGILLETSRTNVYIFVNHDISLFNICTKAVNELKSDSNYEYLFTEEPIYKSDIKLEEQTTDGKMKKNIGKALIDSLESYDKDRIKEFFKLSSLSELYDIYINEDKLNEFIKQFSK